MKWPTSVWSTYSVRWGKLVIIVGLSDDADGSTFINVSYVPEAKLFLSFLLTSIGLGICLHASTTLL